MPLTMRQIPSINLRLTCPQLGTPTISITSDILGFLGYEDLLRSKLGRGKKAIKKELRCLLNDQKKALSSTENENA